MSARPCLAVTPGEPAGIGPEIVLRLALEHPELDFIAVCDPELMRERARAFDLPVHVHEENEPAAKTGASLACLAVPLAEPAEAGRLSPANAGYVLDTLRLAVERVRTGRASALVTGPVNKAIINSAGTPFSGHTEFLAGLAGVDRVVMMLAAPGLRVALVTTHLPLRDVADAITPVAVEETIRITARDLRNRFGIRKPRLQVLGLNPHAGEGGHLGSEDEAIILPAIERCRADGIDAHGPIPADTAFNPPRLTECDAVVAMYHDQGLPVLKHSGFGEAVNITLGLPFIRTSVDHGTALDIAGRGIADAGSLYTAAAMAESMAAAAR
ncbi:4-hydroxythreonine-4-phosphate dehydrogenase PdxA [Elongatibacter sediminis]|uniref:4-hydroxythreonine-4-phosphate dehydrogenase n=1 Tax=Elongatibacter sediminis TaxID=3119006 RepID=A0AAW9RGC9_9GAMM